MEGGVGLGTDGGGICMFSYTSMTLSELRNLLPVHLVRHVPPTAPLCKTKGVGTTPKLGFTPLIKGA